MQLVIVTDFLEHSGIPLKTFNRVIRKFLISEEFLELGTVILDKEKLESHVKSEYLVTLFE